MIKEVTYYQAACDCCGADADYGDYSAWADAGDAVSYADPEFQKVGEDLLCESCWCWPEDLPDYPGDEAWQGGDDPVRKHAEHPTTDHENRSADG